MIAAFTLFQSLLGFLMHCDGLIEIIDDIAPAAFQSLLGFLMHCDPRQWAIRSPPDHGFNPYWVF